MNYKQRSYNFTILCGKKEESMYTRQSSMFRAAVMRKGLICSPVVPGLEGQDLFSYLFAT